MRVLSVAMLLAVVPAFGGQQGVQLAPVALYTSFQQDPPSDPVLAAMRTELTDIMSPMGLRFEWRFLQNATGGDVSVELAVVTFKGSCDLSRPTVRALHSGPLGWTHISEGAILPFADIDCDGLRSFLQPGLLGMRPAEREGAFGRAVARVVAHELYHIFANTQHHGSEGVGKAAYSIQNLLSDDFQFGEKESLALITSKAHEILTLSGSDSRD